MAWKTLQYKGEDNRRNSKHKRNKWNGGKGEEVKGIACGAKGVKILIVLKLPTSLRGSIINRSRVYCSCSTTLHSCHKTFYPGTMGPAIYFEKERSYVQSQISFTNDHFPCTFSSSSSHCLCSHSWLILQLHDQFSWQHWQSFYGEEPWKNSIHTL